MTTKGRRGWLPVALVFVVVIWPALSLGSRAGLHFAGAYAVVVILLLAILSEVSKITGRWG